VKCSSVFSFILSLSLLLSLLLLLLPPLSLLYLRCFGADVEAAGVDARFAEEMKVWYPSYNWEPIEVRTNDNYDLTMFHIWSEENRDASKGPVLF